MVDVRGDVLRPPHGTTPAAVKSNKNQKFILQTVPERALIERHVALEQIEIQWDVESIAISIGNGLVYCNRCILISSTNSDSFCVSVVGLVNALVLGVLPLLCCLPEIIVTVIDITVIHGHHLVARNFNCGRFNDGAVLNHSPVGIVTVQRDLVGQSHYGLPNWESGRAAVGSGQLCLDCW